MRGALTRSFGAALLSLALVIARPSLAADGRPIVRVVLVAPAETPPWFDGFVRHLERELGLRDIDVVVSRGDRESRTPRAPSTPVPGADAELVVEVPTALRPVLRFALSTRDPNGASDATTRTRQVNLAGVPADGCALALAAAADELMRSNWSRAIPSQTVQDKPSDGNGAPSGAEATPRPAREKSNGANSWPNAGEAPPKSSDGAAAVSGSATAAAPRESRDAGEDRASRAPVAGRFRWSLGLAAAGEAFTGGQTQLGGDLRWSTRLLPRFDIELRGGFRRIVRQATTNGAVEGSALVAGGALRFLTVSGARADLSLVGRADLLRASYAGEARDDTTVAASSGSAFGFVLAAGPAGRVALTRALAVEAEVLAGASPHATTATDAGVPVFSTNGAAFLGSLALSLGL